MCRRGDGRSVTTRPHRPGGRGLEDRMVTPQEQQPVRRQPGNEESGRPIRDNMDVERGILELSTGGNKVI